MKPREVWITGLGVVSAAGIGTESLDGLLREGDSALHDVPALGGSFGRLSREPVVPRTARRLDRSARFFFTAAVEAWGAAGLDAGTLDSRRCAVIEGSSLGPQSDILVALRGSGRDAPFTPRPSSLVTFMIGAGGAAIAQHFGIQGPVFHLSAGSVSAACAIGEAFHKVALGQADVALAGGAECPLEQEVIDLFRAAGVLAGRNGDDRACRPFDQHRSGTVLGEGAGVLVLESADHARRRGAVPRAVLRGYGFASESYSMTAPSPDGAGVTTAIEQALCGVDRREIGWIKAHGTGTQAGDAAECRGLWRVFDEDLPGIPLFSLKGALGHCLGASAAVEAVAAVLALEAGVIPPTVGTECLDPDLPPCQVITRPTRSNARGALLLAESFGGRCAALSVALPPRPGSAAAGRA